MDDGIVLGSALGEMIGSTLEAADGTDMHSSDYSFGGSNDGKPVGVLLGDSLG